MKTKSSDRFLVAKFWNLLAAVKTEWSKYGEILCHGSILISKGGLKDHIRIGISLIRS